MIFFQNGKALFLLFLLPLFFILRKIGFIKKLSIKTVFSEWNGSSFTYNHTFFTLFSKISKILTILIFIICTFTLAEPVISTQQKIYTTIGTDIIFLIDTSPSMAAKDLNNTSRLQAAKQAVSLITNSIPENRIGLVSIGSNTQVTVPITKDFSFFQDKLNSLQVGQLGNGSAIGNGISTSVYHLSTSQAQKKCIILLTDGENNAGDIHPQTAANLASVNNITLYIIGIGTKGKVPIEYTDPINGKNYSGYFDSNFDSTSLKKISAQTNGQYFESTSVDELIQVLNEVAKKESINSNYIYSTENKPLYKKFLFFAIISIILNFLIKTFILKQYKLFKLNKAYFIKFLTTFLSCLCILLASFGISWGVQLEKTYKSGNLITLVFDISHSMMAKDGINSKTSSQKTTRLNAASIYANNLLPFIQNSTISIVLAKGEGIQFIPPTQDFHIIESLLEVLSPSFITTPGTSLGKGILKAKEIIQDNKSFSGQIWLFTDGEETDNELQKNLELCVKEGIPVTIIGFGNETETETLAGDGKTHVSTALRKENIQSILTNIIKKYEILNIPVQLTFIDSNENGSATKLLNHVSDYNKDNVITTYEPKPKLRYKFFLIIALLFYITGIIITEMNFSHKQNHKSIFTIIVFLMILSSCSSDTINILKGSTYFQQKKFTKSITPFTKVIHNKKQSTHNIQYATYNLGTTYFMLGEDEIALEYFLNVPENAPDKVKFSSYYNTGVIYHKNGNYNLANDYFKKALQIDSTNINAKINMEISQQMSQTKTNQSEINALQTNQDNQKINLQNQIFHHIKENDKNQWKNSESTQNLDYSKDY